MLFFLLSFASENKIITFNFFIMDIKEKFSVAERVDLEFVLSHLCRRYVESEHCISDSDYKIVDKFYFSEEEFHVLRKLHDFLTSLYD